MLKNLCRFYVFSAKAHQYSEFPLGYLPDLLEFISKTPDNSFYYQQKLKEAQAVFRYLLFEVSRRLENNSMDITSHQVFGFLCMLSLMNPQLDDLVDLELRLRTALPC